MALADNLIAYYKMDNVDDEEGNTYPLTNTGSCTFVAGYSGDAVSVPSGTNKMLGRTDTLGLTANGAFSIRMLIRMASETAVDRELFQLYFNGGGGALYRGLYEYNGGARRVRFFRIGSGVNFLDNSGNIADDTWHQIVYTYDGTNQTLYLDAEAAVTSANTGNTSAGATLFNLGGGVTNQSLNGLMDEVPVWDREITSTEVSDLWNGGTPLDYAQIIGGGGVSPTPLLSLMGIGT